MCYHLLGNHRLNWLILVWWPQDCISAFCQWCGFLASLDRNLQHALRRFAAEGEVVGMRVNTSSSEFMVLCQIMVDCSLLVGTEFLPQVKEFKCLGVLFMSDGEVNRWTGAPSVVLAALIQTVVVKRALSEGEAVNLSGYSNRHLWLWAQAVRSWRQVTKMSFLCRLLGLTLRDKFKTSVKVVLRSD